MTETIFTNARIVLADSVIENGTVATRDGVIVDVATNGTDAGCAIDVDGDIIVPGLVELHTDNLEKHMTPRPKTEWPATAAMIAHDREVIGAGITTVFDSIAVGALLSTSTRISRLKEMVAALENTVAHGLLQADHTLHLRCEISHATLPEMYDPLIDSPLVKLVSIMDHTPGQRQFVDVDMYRHYYQGKFGLNDEEMRRFLDDRVADQEKYSARNRRHAVEGAHARNIAIASHDDATEAHVAEAVEDGMSIAEFPTTVEAAKASHRHGMSVLMGAPNFVRGGSHSGNVSARDLAGEGVLDILSSDYVPHSLLHSAFLLEEVSQDHDLPAAIRTVTKTPAESAGMTDRGEIAVGKRADFVRVAMTPHHPLIRGVWREGERVA